MRKHILITGGAGFAGSHLAIALKSQFPETRVSALDNLSRRGSETNLEILRRAGIVFRHGDVRSMEDLTADPNAPDLILDCAAEPSAMAGYGASPAYTVNTNLLGTYHLLELARRNKADVLFLSTSRIYPYRALNELSFVEEETRFSLALAQRMPGASGHGVAETLALEGPRSIYGATKLASEYLLEEYADAYGFRFIINRCGLLSGPRQMGKSDQGVIVLWMASHFWKQPLRYIGFGGSGKQVRDVLHITDLCDLVIDQVRNFEIYQGQRFNTGGGAAHSISLQELTQLCTEVTGQSIPITSEPANRPSDVRIYVTDNRKVNGVNGWRPQRDVRTCLEDIHQWLQSEQDILKPILMGG